MGDVWLDWHHYDEKSSPFFCWMSTQMLNCKTASTVGKDDTTSHSCPYIANERQARSRLIFLAILSLSLMDGLKGQSITLVYPQLMLKWTRPAPAWMRQSKRCCQCDCSLLMAQRKRWLLQVTYSISRSTTLNSYGKGCGKQLFFYCVGWQLYCQSHQLGTNIVSAIDWLW